MELDELKNRMATLEKVLDKSSSSAQINVKSETAQTKILKKYRDASVSAGVIAVMFAVWWILNVEPEAFPTYLKAFLVIYLSLSCLWYIFLYSRLKRVNVAQMVPSQLCKAVTSIKIMTITGEVVLCVGVMVFMSLFLINLLTVKPFAFWWCCATLVGAVVWGIWYIYSQYLKLFRDMSSVDE